MRAIRNEIGGFSNLMFKEAFIMAQMLDGTIPDNYVQSEKYFAKHKEAIKQRFSEGIGHIDKVALHVRRGDYLEHKDFHVSLTDTDYYKRAIEYFPNEKFLVFCKDNQDWRQDRDDQLWCYDYIKPLLGDRFEMQSVYFKEHEDFNAMASCKGIIMANSSFSWWAAYLGDENKKVICPKQWYVDGKQRTELQPDWILI